VRSGFHRNFRFFMLETVLTLPRIFFRSPRLRPGAAIRWPLGLALAATLTALSGCAEKKADTKKAAAAQLTPVEVMPVERRDLVETLNLVGSVAAMESARFAPRLPVWCAK